MAGPGSGEPQYFSKDFDFEDLRRDVEADAAYDHHHLQPYHPPPPSSPPHPDTSQAWTSFHKRHITGRFFKERRYLLKEFPELATCREYSIMLEVGCGNGSTVLPVLRGNGNIAICACDCSQEALERTREAITATGDESLKHRFHPFQCDITSDRLPNWLFCCSCKERILSGKLILDSDKEKLKATWNKLFFPKEIGCCIGGVDYVMLIFTLSAVPFHMMPSVLAECLSVMKPGGLLFFRDYGIYDMTMLRFGANSRVGFREYMRADGTRSYFFALDVVRDLFTSAGFKEVELEYCCVKSVSRLKKKHMRRVWIHGKFQSPV